MRQQVMRLNSAQLLAGSIQDAAIFSMDALINAADLFQYTKPTEYVVVVRHYGKCHNSTGCYNSTGSHDM